MKISFVIPAYNEEKYLGGCLESIIKELGTVDVQAEIIVVNNASCDGTAAVAAKFPKVRIVDESRKGLVYARAAGLNAASGELIANVDADTIMPVGWLGTALKFFNADQQLVGLSGPHIFYDAPASVRFFTHLFYYTGYVSYLVNRLFFGIGMIQGGNFIIKKTAFEQAGGYDTENFVFYGEDTAVARRLAGAGKVVFTFKLPIYASARRIKKEGILKPALYYAANFFSTLIFNRPVNKKYTDVRPR